MAIQDDYQSWKATQFKSNGGKLLIVDPTDNDTHQIFFDDNADLEDDCIVDARDLQTLMPIPYSSAIDRYVVRCQPNEAIFSLDYFLNIINSIESKYD